MSNKKISSYLLISVLALSFISCSSEQDSVIETYKVKRGNFVVSVKESGELDAVNSLNVSAPQIPWNLGGLKVAKIVEDGKQVEKDEIIAEFDKTEVKKNLEDAKANLDIALAELRKAQATQVSEIEDLESELKKSELQYRISELELKKSAYEAEIKIKEKQLTIDQAKINLEKARQEIANKKKVHAEELSKLELRVKQERSKVEEAEETLEKLTVRAPASGVAIIKRNWATGNKIQVDDELWRGQHMIGLPDLSAFNASVEVNEVDIAKIDTNQKAITRIDAFPDTSFKGHVSEIAALARDKDKDSKVKVFDVTVLLTEKDTTLMPGMTVSCEIIINDIPDTIYVPLEAIFQRDGETIVYIKNGDDFKPKVVITGQDNDNYVIISNGLNERDEIALIDPNFNQLALSKENEGADK